MVRNTLLLMSCFICCAISMTAAHCEAADVPEENKKLLVVSLEESFDPVIREARVMGLRRASLPDDLSSYRAIWFAEPTAVKEDTGGRLRRYVESGGRLLVSGEVIRRLSGVKGDRRLARPWMGISELILTDFPPRKFTFPKSFLGVDLRDEPQLRVDHEIEGIDGETDGTVHATIVTSGLINYTLGFLYTSLPGDGRFCYVASHSGLKDSSGLKKVFIAALRWIMLA